MAKNLVLDYINRIKSEKITRELAIHYLNAEQRLSNSSKNLIIGYCFPRPLLDKELPTRMQQYRNPNLTGSLMPDDGEVTILVEAGQTQQYGRFIKHIMHAFTIPELVNPLSGEGNSDCCICGKITQNYDTWVNNSTDNEKQKREFLTYGSKESEVTLCLDCLIQLVKAKEVMDIIDPGFFDWKKRKYERT